MLSELWSELRFRLRAFVQRDRIERELADELSDHIERETAKLQLQGLSAEQARREARIAFGAIEHFKEESREARGTGWVERRLQDYRYALRGIRKQPGFAIGVVVTLALGIGANSAMFSVVDRLLFRAPPMLHDAGRVHRVYLVNTDSRGERTSSYMAYPRFIDLTNDTHSFERTALVRAGNLAIGIGADVREMPVAIVSARFFGFFDAPPIVGRYYTPAEDTAAVAAKVAVLGYGYWRTHYGGRSAVIGKTLAIGATTYTIVGVAPKGFAGLLPDSPPAAFIPPSAVGAEFPPSWATTYGWTWAQTIVERKPGVSLATVNADLSHAYAMSHQRELDANPGQRSMAPTRLHAFAASILSDRGPQESSLAKVATWVGGVALIVWLIACANVANLLLTRALHRRREIAVRLALGVSRRRLAAQLLTESLTLAILGGVGGLLFAQWGGAAMRRAFVAPESTATVMTDTRTLLYACAAALAAGLLTGLAPLLQTQHADLNRDLRAGAPEGTYQRSRVRASLVVLQGTLSVILLVGAGLFMRSLMHVRTTPLGYHPEQVLVVGMNRRGLAFDSVSDEARIRLLKATAERIPGVRSAARQLTAPFLNEMNLLISIAGIDSVNKLGEFELNAVSPEYFATVGTRIIAGRGIEWQDQAGAPGAMVVSQAMANLLWPHDNPIGKCVRLESSTMPCTYVVGVAENIKNQQIGGDPGYFYYLSSEQFHPDWGGLYLRVAGDPATMSETVRKALQPLMPGASYITVTPMRDIIGQQMQSWQLGASLFVVFGMLALVLAAIGLYSVISFNVRRRLHEIGVRVALGASGREVIGHVMIGGLKLALIGVVLGAAIALALSHWIEPLLFEESARDPAVFAIVAATLIAVAALASFIPARRAARVDPVRALRME